MNSPGHDFMTCLQLFHTMRKPLHVRDSSSKQYMLRVERCEIIPWKSKVAHDHRAEVKCWAPRPNAHEERRDKG